MYCLSQRARERSIGTLCLKLWWIGYEGDFTYEVNNSFVSALMQDENVLLAKLKYAVAVGRNMIAKFEQYKKEY